MEKKVRKVFLLNHGLANGGTDTFCMNVLKYIDRNKFDIRMVLAVDPDSKPQFHEDEVQQLGIPLYKTSDLDGVKKVLRHAFLLYQLLRRQKPDVFHANMDLFNGLNMFVAWLAGVPVRICHSHNSQSQYEANSGKHDLVRIYRGFMRKFLWHFSTVRCGCSEMAMDYLYEEKWKADSSSYVIHNGIDLTAFSQKHDPVVEKNFSVHDGIHYLITVGRFAPQKNPLFVVAVMKDICSQRDDIELLWVGTGGMEKQVRQKIAEYQLEDKIHLLGARKDVPQILKCAEVFVLPSLFEGLGIVLIEAQAAGLPCVVSDRVPQEADMGGCAFLGIDGDATEWSATITNLIDGKTAKRILPEKLQQYDVRFMLGQLEKLYAEKE